MKKKLKTVFGLLSTAIFVSPVVFLFTSCSNSNNQNQNPIDPIEPEEPIDPNSPIKIRNSKHTLSKDLMLKSQNPYQILKQTNTFKDTVKEVKRRMYAENWDFKGYNFKQLSEFLKLNHEVGIMNEYGKNKYERMTFSAKDVYLENDMTQKILDNFNDNEVENAIKKQQNIDEIIKNNQFGYLPSNLSQFLYYLDLNSISNIFNIPNTKTIKMNFDDEVGFANILIIDNEDNKYLFEYLAKSDGSTALKNNNYFRQFIFERSFMITYPRIAYTKPIRPQVGKRYQIIEKKYIQGTGWLLDRIIDNNIPKGYYDFLVGTNLHILDLSAAYNKDREKVNYANSKNESCLPAPEKVDIYLKTYDQKWDGGFLTLNSENDSNKYQKDEILTKDAGDGFVQYEYLKNQRIDSINSLIIKREDVKNNDNNQAGGDNFRKHKISTTQLNNENFVNDLVQYTPTFTTHGTYTDKSDLAFSAFDLLSTYDKDNFNAKDINGKELAYDSWDGYRVGTISNAGADFGITRIRIPEKDVQNLFPSLYPLLNTDQEHDWYVGLGIDNNETVVNANSTLFIGGYPQGSWKSIKSTSGKIYSQQRYLPKEEPGFTQTFWTKYNEQDNKKYNHFRGDVEWYKQRFTSPSMSKEQNDKYMPHGMQIKKILQHSFISFSNEGKHTENDILKDGASGSMMINSRGEITGLLFQGINNDDPNSYANLGLLFKNYSQDNNNFSIIRQVQKLLKNKSLKTLKLNPR